MRGGERIKESGSIRIETCQGIVYLYWRDIGVDCIQNVADEPLVYGDADHGGEEAFCDAVGHVDARGLAPFCHDVAFINDDACGVFSVDERADAGIIGLAAIVLRLGQLLVPWFFAFVVAGEDYGLLQAGGVQAKGGGTAVLPLAWRREIRLFCGAGFFGLGKGGGWPE